MPAAPSIPDTCPHERRPGLTVCLHCRHAAREAEAERRRNALARAALVLGGVAIAATLGVAALRAPKGTAIAAAMASVSDEAASGAAPTLAVAGGPLSSPALQQAAARPPAPAEDSLAASASPSEPAAAAAPAASDTTAASPADTTADAPTTSAPPSPETLAASRPPLPPLVAAGRSELAEGMHVVRVGDSLVVHFDTEMGRTRRPEKFERIVRTTIPTLYGAEGAALLSALPLGTIARAGGLLDELPAQGVRLPAGDGWALVLRPETRPGRDGPIVVRYVATVER